MRWNDRIGRRIKLADLHILLAVAESGSMARAASQLAISHPVISRSISELERNPRAAVIASALEMCANLLRTGRYLAILPEFWLQFPDRHPFIRKLAVELPIAGAPIGIITLKNRTPSPVVQRFIDSSREVAKPLTRRH